MDPFGAGLQEVRSNPQSLVQCWSLLRSRFWLFWFWCQFEKGLFIARSIIAQEIVHCSFLVQIQCPHSNNGAKVLQLAATSCYYYMPRGGFPTFGQVILENLLKESWEKRGGTIFCLKKYMWLLANYFTSSDPHHDMLGGGCQVRVVIENMMGRMENLRTLISGFLSLVILVRWALVTMFLSWTTQTGCRIHRTYVSLIGSGEGRHTTHLLECVLLLSTSQTDWKQSSDVLSDISSDIFFWHIFWHSFWHIFWHSFWHLSDISFDILSDQSFDTLSDISSDISFWHIFRHSFWHLSDIWVSSKRSLTWV